MAAKGFHLFVTLFAFFHLLFMANAVSTPVKIHRHLLPEKVEIVKSEDITSQMVNMEETVFLEDEFINERMDLEKTDYPGPGANKNHTPKPPQRD